MVINKNYLRNRRAGKAETGETSGTGGSASRTGDCGTGETGETGESASRTGDCETGGTGETSGTGESASQSQRMHGAGYVGAIVGRVRRVGVRAAPAEM